MKINDVQSKDAQTTRVNVGKIQKRENNEETK